MLTYWILDFTWTHYWRNMSCEYWFPCISNILKPKLSFLKQEKLWHAMGFSLIRKHRHMIITFIKLTVVVHKKVLECDMTVNLAAFVKDFSCWWCYQSLNTIKPYCLIEESLWCYFQYSTCYLIEQDFRYWLFFYLSFVMPLIAL